MATDVLRQQNVLRQQVAQKRHYIRALQTVKRLARARRPYQEIEAFAQYALTTPPMEMRPLETVSHHAEGESALGDVAEGAT